MTKLEALKKTLYVLENGLVKYNWTNSLSCNCGILAQCALNINAYDLEKQLYKNLPSGIYGTEKYNTSWASRFTRYCTQTGLPINTVFESLISLGFTKEEIGDFENLGDPSILKVDLYDRSNKSFVILYLKAWISKLEQIDIESKVEYRTVIVEIDQKTKDLTKELILS